VYNITEGVIGNAKKEGREIGGEKIGGEN